MNEHHPSCRESDKSLVWHCCQCGINESADIVETELARLRAERDELLADKKRLASVEESKWSVWYNFRISAWVLQEENQVCGGIGYGESVREAIDAAIAKCEEGKRE